MTTPRVREAARVITLDEDDQVLLLRYADQGHVFWATPGGSLEPGEDHEIAAQRELREELGIENLEIGPQLAVRSTEHAVGTEIVRQVERYYIGRIKAHDIDTENATQPDSITEHKWWTLEQLRTSDKTVYPTGLAELITRFLAEGPPETPIPIP